MTDEDASWFENEPCHMLRDRLVVGSGDRNGKGIVFVAIELHEEVQVLGLTPERADYLAKELRRSAGGARAFQDRNPQEDA